MLSDFARQGRVTPVLPSLFVPWLSILVQPHGESFQVLLGITASRGSFTEITTDKFQRRKNISNSPVLDSTQTCSLTCALQSFSQMNTCRITRRNSDHGPHHTTKSLSPLGDYLRSWKKWKHNGDMQRNHKIEDGNCIGSTRKRRWGKWKNKQMEVERDLLHGKMVIKQGGTV